MKKLLLASLLAASLTPFSANAAIACEDVASLAKTIMNVRQDGVSMAKLLGAINNSDDEPVRDIGKAILMDAFEVPHYNGSELKKKEISDFENKWMLACLKNRLNSDKK